MATRVQTLIPANTPAPIGPYSHIAKVGQFITIGGTAEITAYLEHMVAKIAAVPPRAIAEPAYPPMSACDELDGMPKYQVMKFQAIAPSSPPRITFGFTKL